MNYSMIHRLFWKEYRAQRGFWLGVAGTAVLLQVMLLLGMDSPGDRDATTKALFSIAIVLPVFYALGSAAVTFAAEREEETWNRLRILAVKPGRLFAAKFGFSLAATLLMFAVLLISAGVMSRRLLPNSAEWMGGLADWVLATAEFLLWGTFFSLLTRRVLSAVCLTPLVVLAVAGLTSFSGNLWIVRPAIALLLLGVNYRLVGPWLNRETFGFSLPGGMSLRRKRAGLLAAVETAAPARKLFKRLIWQERQQARTVILTLLLIGIPLVALSPWVDATFDVQLAALLIPLVPLICGVWVFRGEQEGKRFRFPVERGIAPETLWLAKQQFWLVAMLGIMLTFLLVDSFANRSLSDNYGRDVITVFQRFVMDDRALEIGNRHVLPIFFLFVLSTYSIGQLVSMLFSRAVTAAFIGFISFYPFLAWAYLMIRLEVPLIFSVWPIPAVLLAATYLRCPDWMLERGGIRPWLKPGITLVASAVLIVGGVGYHRVTEIEVTPELAHDGIVPKLEEGVQAPTAEEQTTADMYRRAMELVTSASNEMFLEDEKGQQHRFWSPQKGWEHATPEAKAWLEENQEVLQLTLEASRRDSCALVDPTRTPDEQPLQNRNFDALHLLVLTSGRKLEAEGKLDEAWDRYLASLRMGRHHAERAADFRQWRSGLHYQRQTLDWLPLWIAHPAQTKERLVKALNDIQSEAGKFPGPIDSLKTEYRHLRNNYRDPESVHSSLPGFLTTEQKSVVLGVVRRFFPWEVRRSKRLFDEIAYRNLQFFTQMKEQLSFRGTDLAHWADPYIDYKKRWVRYGEPPWKWVDTTPFFRPPVSDESNSVFSIIYFKTRQEAARLILALVAYRKEHGEMPEKLDQLVGEFFIELPLDPWSGREFGYRSDGFPTRVRFANQSLEPGQPLLWSSAQSGSRLIQRGEDQFFVVPQEGADGIPKSGFGWVFPIPQ